MNHSAPEDHESPTNAHQKGVNIHPTAHVDPSVVLGTNVEIGPFCCLTGRVTLGDGVRLVSHVSMAGHGGTTVGDHSVIYPFAAIGHPPQDLKYRGEPSILTIGAFNTIREYVTIQPGTEGGGMHTKVGNHNLIMGGVHVAHDVQIGNHVILANYVTIAGHVQIGDYGFVGGLSGIHQFVRIGQHAVVGGMSAVEHDVIPYGAVKGERAHLYGLNMLGLRRRGFDRAAIRALQDCYTVLFDQENGTLQERVKTLAQTHADHPHVQDLLHFVLEESSRSLLRPKAGDQASS